MRLMSKRRWYSWLSILAIALWALSGVGGAASSAKMGDAHAAFSAYGELLAVQKESLTLRTIEGQTLNIRIEPRASVIVGRNKHASLGDLQPGQWIRVRVRRDQAGRLFSAHVRRVPGRVSARRVQEGKAAAQAASSAYFCGQAGGDQPVGDWPMLGHDTAHGFYNTDEQRLHPPLTLWWEWTISSPAVVDGVAYVGAYDGFHALDLQERTELWWQDGLNGDNEFSSPAVVNGVVYFGTWTGDVYALAADTGEILWQQNIVPEENWPQIYSPAVADGVVYLTADWWPEDGGSVATVYALDADNGNVLWSTDVVSTTELNNISDPVVVNGMVYVGTTNYGVYALDASTGTEVWHYPMPSGAWFSDVNFDGYVVVQNGLVYVPFSFGEYPDWYDVLYALDADDGSEVWTYDPEWPEQFSSGVLVHGGLAYLMMEKPGDSQYAYMIELDALTGEEQGRLEQVDDGTDGGWFWLAAANGVIYTTSPGLTVRAYDLSYGGADIWFYETSSSIEVPATPGSGRLVVVDEWPKLYVFEGEGQQGGICGGVYEDTNLNGVWNLGEPGIPGVTINLSGPVALSTSTDDDGTYGFGPLDPGTYTVTETDPPGYVSVAANPGSTGGTAVNPNTIADIPLPAGYSSTDNNFGDRVGEGCGYCDGSVVEPESMTFDEDTVLDYGAAEVIIKKGVVIRVLNGHELTIRTTCDLRVERGARIQANHASGQTRMTEAAPPESQEEDAAAAAGVLCHGKAGKIILDVGRDLVIAGKVTANGKMGQGGTDGGQVIINACRLNVERKGRIKANGQDNGGLIDLSILEGATVDGKLRARSGHTYCYHKGGTINLAAGDSVTVGSTGLFDVWGQEEGGTITATVGGDLTVDGKLKAESGKSSHVNNGGLVHLTVDGDLVVNGRISVNGQENQARATVLAEAENVTVPGVITATGRKGCGGKGGTIDITARAHLAVSGRMDARGRKPHQDGQIILTYCTKDFTGAVFRPTPIEHGDVCG